MEAKLIVVGGKANKAEVKLTLPAVIGRGRDANLTVAHSTVSRRHCLLYEKEGALIVRDNGSLNGTVIEGERITEAVLRPGDTLTVGPLTFRAEYEHFGVFPDLSEKPTLPNVHETVGDKQGAHVAAKLHTEPATTAVPPAAEAGAFDFLNNKDNETAPEPALADSGSELPAVEEAELPELPADIGSELESSLPELDPPAAEEAPSFGFLSDSDATPAAENQAVESAASASEPIANEAAAEEADEDFAAAPLAEIPADSAEIAGLDFLSDDDDPHLAKKDDSPSFGFLGEMDNQAGPGEPESQLPGITLHDSEEPAATESSGEYALSADPIAPPLSFPIADEPIASDESAEIKNGKYRGAAAATKAPAVDAAKPVVDMDAAALDFLSDSPPGPAAAKSSKAASKPAQAADSTPEIKVGPDRPKAAAPEDDELNNFFDSIGLK